MNRGVDGRPIFLDNTDRIRFLHALHSFNNQRRIHPIVGIAAYCLMDNHFHLLLKQLCEGGISAFLHKIGIGYVMYYNKRYERRGRLFQSTFHAVPVIANEHFLHLTRYIHLNPLEIPFPGWEVRGVPNIGAAEAFLKHYPWSSYQHYIGQRTDPVVDATDSLALFQDQEDYESFLREWMVHGRD